MQLPKLKIQLQRLDLGNYFLSICIPPYGKDVNLIMALHFGEVHSLLIGKFLNNHIFIRMVYINVTL